MAEQSGSMQFSSNVNQSHSQSQQPASSAMAQLFSQPARMMSQVTNTFGQMPARMMAQEANMMQRSFVSPQAWLPTVLNAWEEPFVMMRKMSEEIDQFFGRVIQRPMTQIAQSRSGAGAVSRNWTPTIEVSQRGNEMVICADLPGLTKANVQLQIHEDKLTIEGERCEESASQSAQGYHRTERSYGRFYRAIPLPEGVDGHAAQAKMRDGVLEITVPMQNQQRQGERLEIRDAQEGELREQREQQDVRQQRQQQSGQSPGQQRDHFQSSQSGQSGGQQHDQSLNQQHDQSQQQQRQGGSSSSMKVESQN